MSVGPEFIAKVIVHYGGRTLEKLTADLRTLATRPEGWPCVHEELLLLLYCLMMSRFSARLPQPVRDPLWEAVAVSIANHRAAPRRFHKLLAFFRRTPLPSPDDAAVTRCFADPARIRAAIDDYGHCVAERAQQALLSHPMVRLRFVNHKDSPIAVFESRLLKHLGIGPRLEPKLLSALMLSAAAIHGMIEAAGEWDLQDETREAMLRAATEAGNAPDQVFLAPKAPGAAVSLTDAEATEWHPAAEAGDADAQFSLALRYAAGLGVPQDAARAAEWCRRAAEQGHVDSQFNLGQAYARGDGVPHDAARGAAWLRKAADQGHADAQTTLGVMYSRGHGVSKDFGQAAALHREAAEQGNCRGQLNLGLAYNKGEGVPQDYIKAHSWISLAAARSPADGQEKCARVRDEIGAKLTPQQVAEAQMLAREWTTAFEEDQDLDEREYENDE